MTATVSTGMRCDRSGANADAMVTQMSRDGVNRKRALCPECWRWVLIGDDGCLVDHIKHELFNVRLRGVRGADDAA